MKFAVIKMKEADVIGDLIKEDVLGVIPLEIYERMNEFSEFFSYGYNNQVITDFITLI